MANLDSFLGGLKAGNDIAEMGRSQRNRAMIGNLAPAIVGGDPQAFARAAAVDPAAAKDLQASGEGLMKRTRGAAQYLESALKSGNEAQIAAARRSVKPFMDSLKPGASYPMDMDPQQELAGIQSFLAQTAYLDPTLARGMPSQFTALDMQAKAAGYQPGTQGYMDFFRRDNGELARQSSAAIQYKEVPGPDGRPMLVALDPREVGAMTVGGGPAYGSYAAQSGSNAPNATTAAGESVFIDPSLPPEVRSAIMATPDAASIDLAPTMQRPTVTAAANPFSGRRPEDTAAATERAKLQAQQDFLPQELQMRTQADIEKARGVEQAKSEQERASNERAKTAQLNNVDRGLSRIDSALKGLTGKFVDTGPIDGRLMIATPEGQELEAAVGAIQNDMLALTRVPGIGSQSDLEAKIANLKYPSIYNHPSVNAANVQQLRAFMTDLRRQITGQGGSQQAQNAGRTVVRTGTSNGRKVIQYSDGSIEYGN